MANPSKTSALAFCAGTAAGVLAFRLFQRRATNPKEHLWKIVEYSFTGALLHVGDKLGIYDLLWTFGPISAEELAQKAGWSARWVKEFLAQSAGAGLCLLHDDGLQFSLNPEYAPYIRNPDESMDSLAGMFEFLPALLDRARNQLVETVRTGRGVSYDAGLNVVRGMDRKNRNFFRYKLEEEILSKVTIPNSNKSLVQLLEEGGVNVADVGCGCGASTVAMAKRFPKCHFYAYESSAKCLEVLRDRAVGLPITVRNAADPKQRLQDEHLQFALVYTHDVVHDMTHPHDFFRQVRECLTGCWIVVDVQCSASFQKNVQAPSAALNFGFSCLLCLAHATSTPDGQGLGTCGFHAGLCKQWAEETGFTYFDESIKPPSLPTNKCYVLG